MSGRILFEEKQKFGSPLLYLSMGAIYSLVIGVFTYGIYQQLVLGHQFGNKPMSDAGLILTFVLVMLVLIFSGFLLFGSTLYVRMTRSGISFSFWPYFKGLKEIPSDQIASYEVRKYKPILEYGGWGLKKGIKSSGIAYNVRGNIGLQLELKDGKRILFGTERQDAMLHAMRIMMEIKDE